MKMKELEAQSGLGRETIRFYIREGLLHEPERPKRNVAVYNEGHVARLALIKKLQQERFLPLAKIKEIVKSDAGDIDAEHLPSLLGLEFLLSARFSDEHSRQPVALSEVSESTGVPLKDIEEMDQIGFISLARGATMSKQDAEIVALWGQMKEAGFNEDQDWDVQSLERFAHIANEMAARDVEAFLTRLPMDISAPEATSQAEQGILLSNEILGRLRLRAIIRGIAEHNARAVKSSSSVHGSSEDEAPSKKKA